MALAAVVLFAAGAAGTAQAAAGPEKQISFIADQANVWGTGSFYEDWEKNKGYCAVTDLDGNGRLELLFLHRVCNPVPHANANGSNEEKGRALQMQMGQTKKRAGLL